jgi:hypothetical protein
MQHPIGLRQVLDDAPRLLPLFQERTRGLSREEKGIRPSELFFLFAAVAGFAPERIIESGRARAQSTLVLSALFPGAQIISIESDAHSPDVAVAAERLRDRSNVVARFGDSRRLLPGLVRAGDVVLIDGPKDFRAVKLALGLLRKQKPRAVFVHDLWLGSTARNFVDRSLPSAFASDAPEWVRNYSALDFTTGRAPDFPAGARIVYGATLACFPATAENYQVHLLRCALAQGLARLRTNAARFRTVREHDRPPDFTVIA